MSVIYNKTKDGNICIEFLEDEIEASIIVPDIELIIVEDNFDIELTFSSSISSAEETLLDSIILDHDCTGEEEDGTEFDDFATVQLNNLTATNINPTTYAELTTTNIIIENKPEILMKNPGEPNVLIKEDGLYNISFNGILESDVVTTCFEFFILRDGSETVVPHSLITLDQTQALPWGNYNYGVQYHHLNIDIDLNTTLLQNDVLKLKAFKSVNNNANSNASFPTTDSATYAYVKKNSILSVTKLNGATGPKGEDGLPGSSILTLKKGGADKVYNVDKVNFTGNVTVTDDGGGQGTVTVLDSNTNQFLIHQIYGADGPISEPMAFLVDSTRNDKILSIETASFQFGENTVSDNDWLMIHNANNTHARYALPYDGTIIRASASCRDAGDDGEVKLYVNDSHTTILSFDSSSPSNDHCTNINISFNKDDYIRVRGTVDDDAMRDVVVTIWVKWEVRN